MNSYSAVKDVEDDNSNGNKASTEVLILSELLGTSEGRDEHNRKNFR